MRSTVLYALGVLLAGCAAQQSGSRPREAKVAVPAVESVGRVVEPGMPCARAMSVAGRALVRLGYTVDHAEPAKPGTPGTVNGIRQTGWTPRVPEPASLQHLLVTVTCSDAGSAFEASTDEGFFRRQELRAAFPRAIKAAAESRTRRPRVGNEPLRGVLITIEPRPGREATAAFGVDLAASGLSPVQVRIENRTERTYGFRRRNVKLVTQEGRRVRPLAPAAVAGRIGSIGRTALEETLISERDVAPGATLEGFVVVPVSTYRRATVLLVDRATGEMEGFAVEF